MLRLVVHEQDDRDLEERAAAVADDDIDGASLRQLSDACGWQLDIVSCDEGSIAPSSCFPTPPGRRRDHARGRRMRVADDPGPFEEMGCP